MNNINATEAPVLSVVICTRNRGSSVVATLETALANTHSSFEVILVDQSTNKDTSQAVACFQQDYRLRYIHTSTLGLGRARNIGIAAARGSVVAFTDDDCTVPLHWLDVIDKTFTHNPRVGLMFCNVLPIEYDRTSGFIPSYERHDSVIVRSLWGKCRARGIGAGIAIRKSMIQQIGGFDIHLGSGALFPSCEDGDIAVRAILRGWWIYETHEVAVLHAGFRTWAQGKELTKRDWLGIGAAYSKPLKRGRLSILIVIAYEALIVGLWHPLAKLLHFQKPHGVKQLIYFAQGFVHGLCTPVDHQMCFYRPGSSGDR